MFGHMDLHLGMGIMSYTPKGMAIISYTPKGMAIISYTPKGMFGCGRYTSSLYLRMYVYVPARDFALSQNPLLRMALAPVADEKKMPAAVPPRTAVPGRNRSQTIIRNTDSREVLMGMGFPKNRA